jgi:hypothetical protein
MSICSFFTLFVLLSPYEFGIIWEFVDRRYVTDRNVYVGKKVKVKLSPCLTN